jgi:hypothetical protein
MVAIIPNGNRASNGTGMLGSNGLTNLKWIDPGTRFDERD